MGIETLQSLTLTQAVGRYDLMNAALRPATLHPLYVAADASRNAMLQPVYLGFDQKGECWMHCLHLTDIGDTSLKDASSPYGYGGPLSASEDPDFLAAAARAYAQWMTENRVVVDYVRFHPVLGNERLYAGTVTDNRSVVWMDLEADDITAAYPQRLRQTLKKAERAGLVYRECPLEAEVQKFGAFYRQAMADIGADPFYHFDDAYFGRLAASGLATLGRCQRGDSEDGAWLAAGLFLDGQGLREYHLAATSAAGRGLSASAFALHGAALAARRQGLRRLYLGGGSDVRPDNSLLFFKSAYSAERLHYRTGSTVFRTRDYDRLKQLFPCAWRAHPERPIFYRQV